VKPLPLDPNEGWNAYFADAAIHGGVLYPAADALITNNYPPLSFYLVGAAGLLWRSRPAFAKWAASVTVTLALFDALIALVAYLSTTAKLELRDIRNLETDERTALQDIEIIRADGHGHAACEMLDLCYLGQERIHDHATVSSDP